MTSDVENHVRELCRSLPEVSERQSHGAPAFFVGKQFVMLWPSGHHEHHFVHLWCAAAPGAQALLLDANPGRLFYPPYVGGRGWLGFAWTATSTSTSLTCFSSTPIAASRTRVNWRCSSGAEP